MTQAAEFAILGLGVGATYALLAQGVVFVQWGSGVLNLSQAALAMLAAFLYWDMRSQHGWAVAPALVVSVAAVVATGVVTHRLVIQPLRRASGVSRVIATLGVLLLLQGLAEVVWGVVPRFSPPLLPGRPVEVLGLVVPVDRLLLVAVAIAITAGLWALTTYTTVGLAIRAAAENPRAAAALGWSPSGLAAFTWAVGAGLAALAGILIAPITAITVDQMPLLIIPVLAAALVGAFESFWMTLLGAATIGVIQSEVALYVHVIGAGWAVPFAAIVIFLAARGKGVPIRSEYVERMAQVGAGAIRPAVVIPLAIALSALMILAFPNDLLAALSTTFAWAIIMLSVVILLGYTGQLSFEQVAMAGLAALVAGRLVSTLHWPFEAALMAALVASIPIGVVFALPALRIRGTSLAVVTLALGMVVYQIGFQNSQYTGGANGTPVGPQTFLGISIDSIRYPSHYAVFVFGFFIVCALIVANVRRGASGRRLLAVRTNERAAAALGIDVLRAKLFAFVVGASLAGAGGVLLAFQAPLIDYASFDPFNSILVVSWTVIGGVGFVAGPIMGAAGLPGGVGFWLIHQIAPNADPVWLAIVAGVSVTGLVILHPDGSVSLPTRLWGRRRRSRPVTSLAPAAAPPEVGHRRPRQSAAVLETSGVVVRFGGITAVAGVSLQLRSGEVLGLIGPNGAGKTSLIDAVTGFVRVSDGSISFNGEAIERWPTHRRTRAGLGRSFQSLELFEEATVRENLLAAVDPQSSRVYMSDLLRPRRTPLNTMALEAIRYLQLGECLDHTVAALPFGIRRRVAIARTIALEPSILLLDEPASGLADVEAAELAAVLRSLAHQHGLGILVVEHNMAFVMSLCERLLVMDFGRTIASGPPAVVRSDPAVVAAYLGTALHATGAPGRRGEAVRPQQDRRAAREAEW